MFFEAMRLHSRVGLQFLPLDEFALNNAVHASAQLTPFYVNSARHPRVPTRLAVGRPTAPRGSTLGGNEGDKHRKSAGHGILSVNIATRSKAKASVSTPRGVAFRWLNEMSRH